MRAAAYLQQRVVSSGSNVGRIEQQRVREARTPAGGELPVLALDVVDDGTAGPTQQRRDDQAKALPRTRRRKFHAMPGSGVAKTATWQTPKKPIESASGRGRVCQ